MLPNFAAMELQLSKSLTLMEKIIVELREIKAILKEGVPSLTSVSTEEKI